nr:PREDICTED: uncharacterized protein LOC102354169 [Latimeria chalumnae]|eukprot:XP_014347130.1 PREDICTED: uncharacterized protein LOC102354169 [Latimeria chalumnae]
MKSQQRHRYSEEPRPATEIQPPVHHGDDRQNLLSRRRGKGSSTKGPSRKPATRQRNQHCQHPRLHRRAHTPQTEKPGSTRASTTIRKKSTPLGRAPQKLGNRKGPLKQVNNTEHAGMSETHQRTPKLRQNVIRFPVWDTETRAERYGEDVQVTQTPTLLHPNAGNSMEIHCEQTLKKQTMFWYQQHKEEGLKFISSVNVLTKGDATQYEPGFTSRFHIRSKGNYAGSLKISNLTAEDSAVYFCAVGDHSGNVHTLEVTQTPTSLHKRVGGSSEMQCQHGDSNKNNMLWYQQNPRTGPKLIGYAIATSKATNEKDFPEDKFQIVKETAMKGSLTIKELTAADSAVYFCAASQHGATDLSPNCRGEDVLVTQTPTSLYLNASDSMEIHCKQDSSKTKMYWYQQRKREGLKLISYVSVASEGDATQYEPGFTSRFHIRSKGKYEGSLKISKLTAEDSAVYFCAVGDHSGDVQAVELTQTPASLYKRVRDASKMQCQHNDNTKNTMLWYQQKSGTGPKLIGHAIGTSEATNEKDFSKDKFQIVKETDVKGSLTITELTAADSAVYFCASPPPVQTERSSRVKLFSSVPSQRGEMSRVFILLTLANSLQCRGEVVQVTQTPTSLHPKAGDSTEIHCEQKLNKDNMYWYQQRKQEGLKFISSVLLASIGEATQYEPGFTSRFHIRSRENKAGSLKISNLTAEDSAVYFCAVGDHSGYCQAVRVTQSPLSLYGATSNSTELHCERDDSTQQYWYWYQRPRREGPKLMGSELLSGTLTNGQGYGARFRIMRETAVKGPWIIRELKAEDSGVYCCAVGRGEILQVTQTPASLHPKAGDSTEIHCKQKLNKDYIYWYQQRKREALKSIGYINVLATSGDARNEPGFTSRFEIMRKPGKAGSLKISNLTAEDSAVYFCAVGDHSGNCRTLLADQSPPSVYNSTGGSVEVRCEPTDKSYLNMFWYQQQAEGPKLIGYTLSSQSATYEDKDSFNSPKFEIRKRDSDLKGSMKISDLKIEDSGVYFCAVNQHGARGDCLTLLANQSPPSVYNSMGGSVEVRCEPTDKSYRNMFWYRQQAEGPKLIGYTLSSQSATYEDKDGFKSPKFEIRKRDSNLKGSMKISDLTIEDSGVYFCAVNQHGARGECLNLLANQSPLSVYNSTGGSVEVDCKPTDKSYAYMFWYRKQAEGPKLIGSTASTQDPVYEDGFNSPKFEIRKRDSDLKGSMKISELKVEDSGVYFCAVSQHSATEQTPSYTKTSQLSDCQTLLANQSPPSVYNFTGGSVEVRCKPTDKSYAYMFWYRKQAEGPKLIGSTASSQDPVYEDGFNSPKFEIRKRDPDLKGSMKISELKVEDSGVYFCAVSQHSARGLIPSCTKTSRIKRSSSVNLFFSVPSQRGEMSRVFILLTLANWLQCRGEIVQVTQIPASLHPNASDSTKIHCAQDSNKQYMYWYQQRKWEGLKSIGRIYMVGTGGDPEYEPGFTSRFEIMRTDSKAGSLKISNLTAEDSAVYFCAVGDHSAGHCQTVLVTQSPSSVHKNAGKEVEIDCQHNKNDYYYMYWYQQRRAEGIKLIGHTYETQEAKHEDGFNSSKFQIPQRDQVEKGSMKIMDLGAGDSAVYFCAVMQTERSSRVKLSSSGPSQRGEMSRIFILLTLANWMQCRGEIVLVTQTPTSLHPNAGNSMEIHCEQDSSKQYMYWYQQRKREGLKFIGRIYTATKSEDLHHEPEFIMRFEITRIDSKVGSLKISNLTAEDSAVYFCAVGDHSGRGEVVQVTQTPTSLHLNTGKSTEIHCEQKLNKNYMYWYQQHKREGLKLISYVSVVSEGDATQYEPGFTSRFHIRSQENKAGSLKISNLTAEDSAVYFCAVTVGLCWLTNPLHQSIAPWAALSKSTVNPQTKAILTCSGIGSRQKALNSLDPRLALKICFMKTNPKFEIRKRDSDPKGSMKISELKAEDSGHGEVVQVTQTPTSLYPNASDSTEIYCKQDSSKLNMYWYQQRKREGLKLISYVSVASEGDATQYEPGFTSRFHIRSKGSFVGSLKISNLTAEDSAVYFCAAGDHSGHCQTVLVTQSPSSVHKNTGNEVEIYCQHNKSDYVYMYWYQQRRAEGIKLIGNTYMTNEAKHEDGFNSSKFQISKRDQVEKGSMKIVDLGAGDSAVYFCAVSEAQWYRSDHELYKNFILKKLVTVRLCLSNNPLHWCTTQPAVLLNSAVNTRAAAMTPCCGHGQTVSVQQSPPSVHNSTGGSVEFHCQHEDSSYPTMLWYQERRGEGPKLIGSGYSTQEPTYENKEGFEPPKFEIKKETAVKGSLRIQSLTAADSAVYFCAVSKHGATELSTNCHGQTVSVQQSPPSVHNSTGGSVEFHCQHEDTSYLNMLWYQKRRGEGPKLIGSGYSTQEPKYEKKEGFEPPKFEIIKETDVKGSLTIQKLTAADSAVYFCAASQHGATELSPNCHGQTVSVQQSPPSVHNSTGGSVELHCQHEDASYLNMLWYQKRAGEGPKLIGSGYSTQEPTYENKEGFEPPKFEIKKKKNNLKGSLTVTELTAAESAMYFCAVSKHGHGQTVSVQQSPPSVHNSTGGSVEFHCQHEDASYNTMVWYQKRRGEGPRFIGYAYLSQPPEYEKKEGLEPPKFEIKKDKNNLNGSLTITELTAADSAVYFCAVSKHGASDLSPSSTKTS